MFWRRKRRDTADTETRPGPPADAPPSDFAPPAPPPSDFAPIRGAFSLAVEDAFQITGRGTAVTGVLADGVARVGQAVLVSRGGHLVVASKLLGVEATGRRSEEAAPGAKVGLLLQGVTREQVQRGNVVTGR